MKEFFPIIHSSQLFSGVSKDELPAVLSCLEAKKVSFPKDAFLLRTGDTAESIGLVLSGSVLIIQEDAAFACAPGAVLNVSVAAGTDAEVMFLNVKRILTVCSNACGHHGKILRNLLGELAEKNLRLNKKLSHMGQRTTRAKLMSYLSAEAQRLGKHEFDIPFSRQQLADYLAVERSGLSLELGKMRAEGLLDFHKNHFVLKV